MRDLFNVFIICFLSLSSLKGQDYLKINTKDFETTAYSLNQDLKVQHISVEDGLSQGSNYTMLKDSRGFMWFTSYEGLNRYDGKEVVVFRETQGECSIKGSNTCGLVEDGLGNIWFGTEEGLNVWRFQENCFQFFPYIDRTGLANKTLTYPFYADSSSVWYINDTEGLVRFNFITNSKRLLSDKRKYSQTNNRINSVVRTSDGKIWIREREGIVQFNPLDKTNQWFFSNHPENKMGAPQQLYCLIEEAKDTYWLGGEKKIIQFNPIISTYKEIDLSNWLQYSAIGDIRIFQDSLLWLGTTEEGSLIFNPKTNAVHSFSQEQGLTTNANATIYIDDQETVWVNVDPDGINQISQDFSPFKKYILENIGQDFSSFTIRRFFEMPDGKIWVGTEMSGVFLFNPVSNKVEKVINRFTTNAAFSKQGRAFWLEKGNLWIGSDEGIYLYDLEKEELSPRIHVSDNVDADFIWDFQETSNGTVWIATDAGIFFKNKNNTEIKPFEPLVGIRSGKMYYAQERLFIPEHFNGVYVLSTKEELSNSITLNHLLPEVNVKCMYYQEKKNLWWIATNSGLLKVSISKDFSKAEIISNYEVKDGLSSNYIYSILPDEFDNLWLSTNKGIVRFTPSNNQFNVYDAKEDVQGLEFNTNAFLKTTTGEIYFGGVNGFNSFLPATIQETADSPIPAFTSLKVNEQLYDKTGYVGAVEAITLNHDQNTIELGFVTPDFLNEGQNEYQYRLQNFDKEWITSGQRNFARYTQLPPGDYLFQVKASNGSGKWNPIPRQLSIRILSPWWKTYWAYLLYVLGIGFIISQFLKYRLRRRELTFTLQLEQAEAKRLKELDTLKNHFFTNITHEFRTPLTVIKGLAEQIRQRPNHQLPERLEIIDRNTHNIQLLIDQLLDLSKLETGSISINYEKGDVIKFLGYLTESFHSLAFGQKINLSFYSDINSLVMDYDAEKLKQILTNLLMNALKFTPEYGKILVVAGLILEKEISIFKRKEKNLLINEFLPKQDYLKIKVKDSGNGISTYALPHIFDRFFKAENESSAIEGSGIGLALVKELVTLLDGVIVVNSQFKEGSSFTIFLPIVNKIDGARISNATSSISPSPVKQNEVKELTEQEFVEEEMPLLLIVEDNADVIYYIKSCVSRTYQVIEAQNGKEGLAMAIQEIPDLIISDVMMPEMDGYELGAALQQNTNTSHIPFLLLTAKASQESKRKGLEAGALAYLIKPFDKEELLIRLQSLLKWKGQLQEYLQQQSTSLSKNKNNTLPSYAKEVKFLELLDQQILLNLEDEDFKTQQLAKKMAMSESQLYRKLKATTNQSTAKYIQNFRLQEAHQLLLTTDLQVGEVAVKVGFKQVSHFSKAFQKHFNIRPSDVSK